ncbi:MAG: hypothetical protein F2836_02035 [Actinobacteria bacterium]|uniref:Unannotated protein n=1 Tax=freshwater metagenome TaxID=449393 RepID=A0A6J7I2F5_9ZZZZ|nr:hypothetical protein [Actinomycetota bacterium]
MRRASRLVVLGFTPLLLTVLGAGLLGGGTASAVDTPTEPPPCGNTGQPCVVGSPAPAPAPAPTCGEGGPACTEPPPGETWKAPTPVANPTPTAASTKQPTGGSTTSDSGSGSGGTSNGGSGGNGGGNGGGTAPTVVIGAAKLIVGTPVAVSIAFVGGDVAEGAAQQSITVTVTVGAGTVSIGGGPAGSRATVTGPFSSLRDGVPAVLVTAARAGEVTIDVQAAPSDRPSEGISGSRALAAPEPVQTPTPTPVPAVTEASAAQVVAPAGEVVAEPVARGATTQQRSITLPTYQPLDQPQQVVDTTVAVVAVLGAIGLSAGALAGGIPAPTAPTSPSSPSDPANRRAEDAGRHQGGHVRERRSEGSLSSVDVSFTGLTAGFGAAGVADRWRIWRPPLTAQVDRSHHISISSASRLSPLTARLLADSTYLRAMFGSSALLLPIAAVVLAVMGVIGVNGLALAPSVAILGLITFIGTLDAMAGFAAFVVFGAGVGIMGGITGADSIRTLLGLGVIGFGPALIAGSTRPLRRGRTDYDLWERLTDFVIIPLIGAFAVQSMVSSLSGLSGYQLPIVSSANVIALIALIGLLLRVSLEEFAARAFPGRIAEVAPAVIPVPGVLHRSVVAAVRTILFVFVAIAFIGTTWQLWAGAAIFAAAQACDILAKYTPNSPRLFHATPVGIPKLVVILLVSLGISTAISLLVTSGPDLARTAFVLLMLPGLALAALGMFAKEPHEGDTRWYLRPTMRVWYRVGGAVLLVTAIYMTQFA